MFSILTIAMLFLTISGEISSQQQSDTKFRALNASPDVPAIDIYTNDDLILNELNFKELSSYQSTSPGEYTIKVFPEGADPKNEDPLLEEVIKLNNEKAHTIVASGKKDDLKLQVFGDDLSSNENAKVRLVHLAPGAPSVDIIANDKPIFEEISYREGSEYIEVPAGTYNVSVLPSGQEKSVFDIPNVTLHEGTNYSAFAIGILDGEPMLDILLTIDE